MNTLYKVSTQNELREAARLKGLLQVKVGRTYSNWKGESIKIVGKTTVPGWPTPFFVDSQGRRYDKFGFSYDAEKFPYSRYDLIAPSRKMKLKRALNQYNQASRKKVLMSLLSSVNHFGAKLRTNLKPPGILKFTKLSLSW